MYFCKLNALHTALFLIASIGCNDLSKPNSNDAANSKKVQPLTVNVALATQEENVYESSTYFGIIKARSTSQLAFARTGRISEIFAEVGSRLKKGDRIAALEQEQLQREQQKLERQITLANQNLARLQAENFRTQQDQQKIQELQEALQTLSIRQEELTVELRLGILLAPYDGILAEHSNSVGDSVSPARPIFKLLQSGQPVVEINFPSRMSDQLQLGRVVWIKKNRELMQAEITTISPEISRTSRTLSVHAKTTDSTDKNTWKFGEVVEVLVWKRSDKSGFWLPYSALNREADDIWSTYVLESEQQSQFVSRRIVEILLLEDTHVLCAGDLKEGDLYITAGLNRVVVGQRVVGNITASEYFSSEPPEM